MPNQVMRSLSGGKQVVVAGLAILIVFLGYVLYRSLVVGREARLELVSLYGQLRPGLSVSEVEQLFSTDRFRRLKLLTISPELVMVRTPLEWNANNWILWINVTNSQIYQLRIRLEDDVKLKPADAPLDKLADGER